MKTSITNLKGIETFALKSFPKLPFHNKEGKPYQGIAMCSIQLINVFNNQVNRNLCGFLNTGAGGIVYIGIDDEGKVLGVSLTPFQKDHVLLSVQDTFSRFEPPVDSTMYEVRFIPVIRSEDEKTNFTSPVMDSSIRKTPHAMRTSRYCWCDDEAKARFDVVLLHFLQQVKRWLK